jgi:16S rRNA (guanine527-N7)-methyltransferase
VEFRRRLTTITQEAAVALSLEAIDLLEAYFSILTKWNARINLTALPLQPPTDQTFQRLFVEPLCAATRFPEYRAAWFDLGTGGGSPAIPIKIARPLLSLTMVESKVRKAAFLREATRLLHLSDTATEQGRFDNVARRFPGTAKFVTVRAVKVNAQLVESANRLLMLDGKLMLFRQDQTALEIPGFEHVTTIPLGLGRKAYLSTHRRMFHVEQSR